MSKDIAVWDNLIYVPTGMQGSPLLVVTCLYNCIDEYLTLLPDVILRPFEISGHDLWFSNTVHLLGE